MMDFLRDKMCRWFCHRQSDKTPPVAQRVEMPEEIRQASHRMATASANIQGVAYKLKREPDVMDKLVNAMQGGPRR